MTSIRRSFHMANGLALLVLLSVTVETASSSGTRKTVVMENNIFAAIEHMKTLVDVEKSVVYNARTYLLEQRRILNELAPFKNAVEEAMLLAENNTEGYLGNPINSFLLIKRLSWNWKELKSQLGLGETSLEFIGDMLATHNRHIPTETDVGGAISAFIRLMDTYAIGAREFTEGKISLVEESTLQLTAADCMDIAYMAHTSKRYVRMKEWLLEAERLINDPTRPDRHGNTTPAKVNEFLAWAYYMENDSKNALKYTELLLQEYPQNKKFLRNKEVYEWHNERNIPMTYKQTKYMAAAQHVLQKGLENTYIQACRGNNSDVFGYTDVWNLRCFYRRDSPLLYLKPVKVTQLHDAPEVYILHDILSDNTMDRLKKIAAPRMQVARVVDVEKDDLVSVPYRVSKSMFLLPNYPSDRMVAEKLDPILSAVSGMSLDQAEDLQINNYGLGGQYEFHHDYGEPGTLLATRESGNRIATLLLYLSNVERGGETVFTEIGLSVPPMKGSAVFWYNLHRNGTGFFNTMHASCPVLSGSKWVANKWIKERGNEFVRPCSLNQFE